MLIFRVFIFFQILCFGLITVGAVDDDGFVKTNGMQFILDGKPFFANGFNAYWLMTIASTQSDIVSSTFAAAASHDLKVVRTWAFSDGGDSPLQFSPGYYNQKMFLGLDFVINEARKNGLKLILSLVNNYEDYGGRSKYVEWGRAAGAKLSSDDEFFTNSVVKGFYKNHIKAILMRKNSITGGLYKDDPTIMAWELMNEPRVQPSFSQDAIHLWVEEMAAYVKSIDTNHLVEAGLEGFYGQNRRYENPNSMLVGTDFISSNQLSNIDFCTVHCYPETWLPESDFNTQIEFVKKWVSGHIEDAQNSIGKPVVVAEFGRKLSSSNTERDEVYRSVYSTIHYSAMKHGPASGALFWQVLGVGLESWNDGYGIFLTQPSSTIGIIDSFSRIIKHV